MGGHGGLNILPQKRWNVYNFDNREKVRKDEEAAAKEEQLKQEETRRREAEFRLEKLRAARGYAAGAGSQAPAEPAPSLTSSSNHINLFDGLKGFEFIGGDKAAAKGDEPERDPLHKKKKMKKEEPKVALPEDEKYRMGYGIAGKGVKLPWYLAKPSDIQATEDSKDGSLSRSPGKVGSKSGGKKSLQELREERLKREKKEEKRERSLVQPKSRGDGGSSSGWKFSTREQEEAEERGRDSARRDGGYSRKSEERGRDSVREKRRRDRDFSRERESSARRKSSSYRR